MNSSKILLFSFFDAQRYLPRGGVDSITMRPILVVDGMSDKANQCLVNLLHEIINNGLKEEEWARVKDKF